MRLVKGSRLVAMATNEKPEVASCPPGPNIGRRVRVVSGLAVKRARERGRELVLLFASFLMLLLFFYPEKKKKKKGRRRRRLFGPGRGPRALAIGARRHRLRARKETGRALGFDARGGGG